MGKSPLLSPRPAYAIVATLEYWAGTAIDTWLGYPDGEFLFNVSPVVALDRRVFFFVGESRAWASAAQDRCYAFAKEIEQGMLPFQRDGAHIDELLLALALHEASRTAEERAELLEGIPTRVASDLTDGQECDSNYLVGDDDWDLVFDLFVDLCRWEQWEIPRIPGHPRLPDFLADHHPFTWFDAPYFVRGR